MPSKKETIKLLEEIADMLEFNRENRYKVLAYRAGANALRKTDQDFDIMVKRRELNKIKGIGSGLQKVIYEFYDTNESTLYNTLRNEIPSGLESLLKIKGLNPNKIRLLYSELGIKNLEDLEKAAKNNLLLQVKGFGSNLQNKVLTSLKDYKRYKNFILLSSGLKLADEILNVITGLDLVKKAEKSGELRRGSEIISRLDFVILTTNKSLLIKELGEKFSYSELEDKIVIEDYAEVPIFLFITKNESEYNRELFLTTGSIEFLGIIKAEKIRGSTEEEIFRNLNLPVIIPEMREKEYFNHKKILVKNSSLTINDLKGLLHLHSTYSDGRNTLREMVTAAKELEFEYASINDHSKSAHYANGLDEKRIIQEIKELRAISSEIKLPLFAGIEADILTDGSLDFTDEFLSNFDFVIASVHSRFNLEEKEMTNRIIKAVENPYVDVLGHPSGRMLLSRAPYKFNIKKVIDACSSNKVAIEINASPRRLDLDWRWVYYAREKECLIAINTDAHSISEISYLFYGIMMGRKAGLQPDEVINCFSLNKFKKFLNRRIKRELEN